jgi:hypothetical protein
MDERRLVSGRCEPTAYLRRKTTTAPAVAAKVSKVRVKKPTFQDRPGRPYNRPHCTPL